jgi:chloride channel protein, CIC family
MEDGPSVDTPAVRPIAPPWLNKLKALAEVDRLQRHEDKLLLVLTLLIGAVVGLVVVAFIVSTEWLSGWLLAPGSASWRRIAVPAAGALVSGILLARYFPNARGSGIPQTKTALFLERGYIRLTTVVGKFVCAAISLGSGIALGREGPTVQVGAGIASTLGRRLGLGPRRVQALVPIGTSAALAAAFNTPISAVLFTLEEILGDLHAPVLGSIVIASATSWAVLRLVLGDEPLFHVPAYQLVHPLELVVYAALGIVGGLVSVAFVKLLLGVRRRFLRMPRATVWWQPAAGGLAVGLLGFVVPNVLGVGYGLVGDALNGRMVLGTMAVLMVLKVVATATAYGAGNSGGIFGPSLFIGAMLGGSLGSVAHAWLPDVTGSPGAYALVGMGAAFAGIIRAPMTSVIMIFEITRDYSIIVPVMIANLLSYFISQRLQREPVYEALLHQDGIALPPSRMRTSSVTVEQAFRPPAHAFSGSDPVLSCLAFVDRTDSPAPEAWPVLDGGRFVGMVTRERLRRAAREGAGPRPLETIVEVPPEPHTAERFPHVHADQGLDVALERMGQSGLDVIPVVSRSDVHDLLGLVALADIPTAYSQRGDEESPAESAHVERASPRVLLMAVLAGVLGLFLLGGLLANHYYSARTARARASYVAGMEFVRQHRDPEAVEAFRTALSLVHTDVNRLALGLALARSGRDAEARVYLTQVLQRQPDDGPANLAMARLQVGLTDIPGALASYRRAISGVWATADEPGRTEGVFELIDLLEKTGATREAEAELLRESGRTSDPQTLARVGRGLLGLRSNRAAAEVFHEVIAALPQVPDGYTGLGEALLAQEDYRSASRAFHDALRVNPDNGTIEARARLCDEILSLDPTLKGLSRAQRLERSRRLTGEVLRALDSCQPSVGQDDKLIAVARRAASATARPSDPGAATEANLDMAERLWGVAGACGTAARHPALARVLARVQR